MKKLACALAAAATLVGGSLAATSEAEARPYRYYAKPGYYGAYAYPADTALLRRVCLSALRLQSRVSAQRGRGDRRRCGRSLDWRGYRSLGGSGLLSASRLRLRLLRRACDV